MAVGPDDPGQDHSKNQNWDEPVRPKDVPRSVGWPESQSMDVQNRAANRMFQSNSEELQRRAATISRDDGPTQEPDYDNDLGAILSDRDKSHAALKREHVQSVGDGTPQSPEPDHDNDLGAILADRDKMRGRSKELEHEQGDDLDAENAPSQEPDLDNDLNALMNLKNKSAHRDYGVLKREQGNTPDRVSDGDKDIGENELTFTSGKTGPELDRGR